MPDEKLIAQHMKMLGITREEAIQLIAEDKAIDRGAEMFGLDPELEKGAKKARRAKRKANTTPVKREKKAKPEKVEICSAMMDSLRELGIEDFTIKNPEREFTFIHDGKKYRVTLACPRS